MNNTNNVTGGNQKSLVGMKVAPKIIIAKITQYRLTEGLLCVSIGVIIRTDIQSLSIKG